MSSNQPQNCSIYRRPNYLNTGSPDLGPFAPEGGDTEDRPFTDESDSEFTPSSSPIAIPTGRTSPTVSSSQASRSTDTAASPATPLASTQQSGSTASSSRQRRSDAPSPFDHPASSAAEVDIFEDPASPRPNDDTPRKYDSTHREMESPDQVRAPLAPIMPRNARSVNAPNPPLKRTPDFHIYHTVNHDGKRVPSRNEHIPSWRACHSQVLGRTMSSSRPQTAHSNPWPNRWNPEPRRTQYLLPNTLAEGGGRHVPYPDDSGSEYVPSSASAISSQSSGTTDSGSSTAAAPSGAPRISSQSVDSATPVAQARVSQVPASPRSSAGTESASGRGVSSRPGAVAAPDSSRAPLSPSDANAVAPGPSQRARAESPNREVRDVHIFCTSFHDTTRERAERFPSNGEMMDFSKRFAEYETEFQAEL